MDIDVDMVAMAGHGLVYTVIHHLVHQVMKPGDIHISDIHRRSEANRLQTFKDIDTTGVIFFFHT
jgi:hypothetical protein